MLLKSACGICSTAHMTPIASSSQRVWMRFDRKPTSTVDTANSQKKLPATTPNCAGDRFRSRISGTATMPSTILSRKLMRASAVSISVVNHAARGL